MQTRSFLLLITRHPPCHPMHVLHFLSEQRRTPTRPRGQLGSKPHVSAQTHQTDNNNSQLISQVCCFSSCTSLESSPVAFFFSPQDMQSFRARKIAV
jgi:hypothetical protein